MEELTEKQIKNRWVDIKKHINERQLLAYRVGIPLDKWDNYMHSIPSVEEINRIYFCIQEDRINKTLKKDITMKKTTLILLLIFTFTKINAQLVNEEIDFNNLISTTDNDLSNNFAQPIPYGYGQLTDGNNGY